MKRIVVGVDPQPAGQRALDWALREARVRCLPLTVVRSWLTPVFGMYYPAGSDLAARVPDACDEARQVAEDMLKLAVERIPGADAVVTSVETVMGAPAQVLVEIAGTDSMLVVGSRGAGVLSRAVLGSVSSAVLHHACCPVVVVPERADASTAPHRVLVGVDHSAEALAALRIAVPEAQLHGARLVPLFAHDPALTAGTPVDLALLEASERESLRAAAVAAGARATDTAPEVVTGHPGEALLAATRPTDLLVLGSRGRGGFAGLLLGSTSTQVAQHAQCPVMVVRST